jgi:hypothetical protein
LLHQAIQCQVYKLLFVMSWYDDGYFQNLGRI